MIPLQVVTITLVGLGALAVVTTRDPLRQSLVLGFYGLLLGALFVVFQAPDVALSEFVVSSVAVPFVLLTALAKLRRRRRRE
jgi:energy-converting hydrogenase B subunit D